MCFLFENCVKCRQILKRREVLVRFSGRNTDAKIFQFDGDFFSVFIDGTIIDGQILIL